jgi:UDP-N-acetylglucosamine transferase subunit ALG13
VSTFVSVGNATQPFDRLLGAVCAIVAHLPPPVIIQTGSAKCACDGVVASKFVAMDEFERLIDAASLVVMHAGAGSVIHAVHAGKVPVLMPRRARYGEHIDDHQLEFARQLADAGLAVVAEEPQDLRAAVVAALERQRSMLEHPRSAQMLQLVGETLRKYL